MEFKYLELTYSTVISGLTNCHYFLFYYLLFISYIKKGSIYEWVRLHRLHHQTFKTAEDPFYSDKDFLNAQVFAHVRKLSPRQEKLLQSVDMKDIEDDSIVMFQKRYELIHSNNF